MSESRRMAAAEVLEGTTGSGEQRSVARGQRSETGSGTGTTGPLSAEVGGAVVTREELALVLRVSVRTVDKMVAAEEIPCMRLRDLVRFNLPNVLRHLTATAMTRKHGPGKKTPVKGDILSPKAEGRRQMVEEKR
jgi:excisionase family DNA binding protein